MDRRVTLRLFLAILMTTMGAANPIAMQAAPVDRLGGDGVRFQSSNTVIIYLTDQFGNPLAGGCFDVTDFDSIEGVPRTQKVCDGDDESDDGKASLSGLFDGEVDVVQTVVPEGCSEAAGDSVVVDGGSEVPVFLDNNCPPPAGAVQITLVDQDGAFLPGGCFLIYFPDGPYSPEPDVCDANDGRLDGTASLDYAPAGQVGVHQTGTSEGCEPAEDMTAEVVGGETANVTMFNSCASSKGALDIRLMDPNGNLLGRGCFQIFDAAGSVIAEDCDDGDGVAHFTGLPEGRVTVVQTSAPEGYACCDSGSADVVEGQVSELNLVNAPVVLPPAEPTPTPVVPRITGLVLNEVLFQPPTGSPQFVELKNAGSADLNLDGVSLLTRKGERYRFPAGLRPLPPGGFLLVVFDGEDRVEGNTVHADRTSFMAPEADVVYLRDPADRRLDRIAWGERLPDAVNLSRGGFVAPLDPGTSIGRFPGSTRATDRFDWVTYPSARSSPGRANPLPRVEILLPLDGSVFDGPNVHVSWYVVAGAAKYHLEVASEQSFATLVDDADVTVPPHPVGPLASGRYFWRVQSIAADGSRSAFSPIASFEIRAPGSARLAVGRTEAFQAGSTRHTLEVPLIAQHKDTALLLVESDQPSPHAWDEVHPGLDPGDPADLMNCGLAAAAMVNAYFGGDVSQDQIGFHLFRNVEGGPEGDLNYGKGVSPRQETDALRFALGLGKDEIELKGSPLPEDFWEDVVSEISVGRPIVVAVPGHVEVVIGYDAGETRLIGLNDPFTAENGPTWVPVEKLDIRSYWRLTRTPSRPFRTTGRRLTPTRMGSWTSTRMCDSERIRPKETRMATASGTSARSATDGSTGRFVKT